MTGNRGIDPAKGNTTTVADLDLELSGEGTSGFDLLARLAFLLSVISSFFTHNKVGARAPRPPPLDLPLHKRITHLGKLRSGSLVLPSCCDLFSFNII